MMAFADRLDKLGAQQKPIDHGPAADVEVAVTQPQALLDRSVRLVDVEGRSLGLAEDGDLADLDLDVAGLEIGVLGAGEAARDGALDLQDELGANSTRDLSGFGRLGFVDYDLGHPVAVA